MCGQVHFVCALMEPKLHEIFFLDFATRGEALVFYFLPARERHFFFLFEKFRLQRLSLAPKIRVNGHKYVT